MKKRISIVIPCYRSASMIEGVVGDIDREMEKLKDSYRYEIILVNDSSPDETFEVIRGLCREKPYITGPDGRLPADERRLSGVHG